MNTQTPTPTGAPAPTTSPRTAHNRIPAGQYRPTKAQLDAAEMFIWQQAIDARDDLIDIDPAGWEAWYDTSIPDNATPVQLAQLLRARVNALRAKQLEAEADIEFSLGYALLDPDAPAELVNPLLTEWRESRGYGEYAPALDVIGEMGGE